MERPFNLLIVSDLHLNEGLDPETGKTSRLEDFHRDGAFARFLHYHEMIKEEPRFGGRPWLLVLNGDIFDFLQVISLPQDGRLLQVIKDANGGSGLTSRERVYGLGTTALETEWKLKRIARGHPSFFAALGWFVARGNRITVVRGNHDVELFWEAVQDRFVTETRRAYMRQWLRKGGVRPEAPSSYHERIDFCPRLYYEPARVYVEHGSQYDVLNHFRDVLNPVLPDDPDRIELPWGSLFVRYLFNEVEDVHPFADNVKPLTRYLGWAFKKNPFTAIGVLVGRGWTFVRALWLIGRKAVSTTIPDEDRHRKADQNSPEAPPSEVSEAIEALARRQVDTVWQTWVGALMHSVISLLSLVIVAVFSALAVATLVMAQGPRWLVGAYLAAALVAGLLRYALREGFSYLLRRDDLREVAAKLEQILGQDQPVAIITMGHNHGPAVERLDHSWYVNTGAWVRLFDRRGPVEGREILTFLRVAETHDGAPELLRWDDGAGAPTRVVLPGDPRSAQPL